MPDNATIDLKYLFLFLIVLILISLHLHHIHQYFMIEIIIEVRTAELLLKHN